VTVLHKYRKEVKKMSNCHVFAKNVAILNCALNEERKCPSYFLILKCLKLFEKKRKKVRSSEIVREICKAY
jgi:hypothetical protein